ncbi:MAG: hypothetical protein GY811_08470 [Myxococcales bacterium]|nr:hypothetical protein [Myxococcales bacterium]
MGRLATFLARILEDGLSTSPIGIGIDEATALVIDGDGTGEVIGAGSVYVLSPHNGP